MERRSKDVSGQGQGAEVFEHGDIQFRVDRSETGMVDQENNRNVEYYAKGIMWLCN